MFDNPPILNNENPFLPQQSAAESLAPQTFIPLNRDVTSRFEDLRAPRFDLEHLSVTLPEALEAYSAHREELKLYRERALQRHELSFGAHIVLISLPDVITRNLGKPVSQAELLSRQDNDLTDSPYSHLRQAAIRFCLIASASTSATIGFVAADAPFKLMLDLVATPTAIGLVWAFIALNRFATTAKQQVQFAKNLQKTLVELVKRSADS